MIEGKKMKVIVRSGFDDEGRNRLMIYGIGLKLDFLEGDSEDATLGRDYAGCYSIDKFIKQANILGLNGVEIEVEQIEDNDIFSEGYENPTA